MKNKTSVYLYLALATMAWGSMYVVSKFILAVLPSFAVLFIRYLLSGIILLLLLRRNKQAKIEHKDYKFILFIGIVGYFLSIGAQLLGTQLSNASLASLINSLNPIFMIIFAVPILKEKVTPQKIVSVAAAIAGVYIIIGGEGSRGTFAGILISLFSVISWSLMSVTVRRITQKYDALAVTTYGILVGAVCALPASAVQMAKAPQAAAALLRPSILLGLIYIAVVCTAFAHLLWNKSLSMMEAGKCSLFYPLQPMTSALLGFVFLHETLHLTFLIGAVLIISGVLFSFLPIRIGYSTE